MSEQVSAVLDELAARFGATGAALWESFVRYEIALAWFGLAFVTVLVFTSAIGWVVGVALDDDDIRFGFAIFAAISLGVAAIVGSYAIPTLLAPEAAVIRGLLR